MTEVDPEDVHIECKEDLGRHIDGAEHVKNKKKLSTITWSFSITTSEGVSHNIICI